MTGRGAIAAACAALVLAVVGGGAIALALTPVDQSTVLDSIQPITVGPSQILGPTPTASLSPPATPSAQPSAQPSPRPSPPSGGPVTVAPLPPVDVDDDDDEDNGDDDRRDDRNGKENDSENRDDD